jgi:ABC-type methionine transport system ATPase subunit
MEMSSINDDVTIVKMNFTFPASQVREPALARAVAKFGVSVDIRKAQVEENVGGYIMCQVTGATSKIDSMVEYLKSIGVGVGFIGSDDVQAY